MLSKKALLEFKEIYRQEFGAELGDDEVLKKAIMLLTMFQNVYRPVPKK